MSVLEETVNRFAEQLDDALSQHSADIASLKTADRDKNVQLGAMHISLMAVRREVLERLDAMETTVLEKLDAISRQLGTNGSGGKHG